MTGTDEPDGAPLGREVAREKAAAIRAQHRKQERRRRVLIVGGIVVAVLAIVAIVTTSLLGSIKPERTGPLNMLSDGIRIEAGLAALKTSGLPVSATPVPNAPTASADVVDIRFYVDYACGDCSSFATANAEQLRTWVESGAATLEVHPIATLDAKSKDYSSRAANAAACVANYDPDRFFDFNERLLQQAPDEGESLSDDDLGDIVAEAGVGSASAVEDCITEDSFATWVSHATERALAGPIAGSDVQQVTELPLVLVNGMQFSGPYDDATAFSQFVVQAAGATFAETSTETPTDSATATP
ncbi:MAG: thioredoxin domain-containing protein [Microbacteriaceae bacterium]